MLHYKLCLKLGNADLLVCLFPSCCPSDIVAAVSATKHPIRPAAVRDLWGKRGGRSRVRCCNDWENCQGSDVKPAESRAAFVYPLPGSVSLTRPFLWSGCMSVSGNPRVCLFCASDTAPAPAQETSVSQRNESDHSRGS